MADCCNCGDSIGDGQAAMVRNPDDSKSMFVKAAAGQAEGVWRCLECYHGPCPACGLDGCPWFYHENRRSGDFKRHEVARCEAMPAHWAAETGRVWRGPGFRFNEDWDIDTSLLWSFEDHLWHPRVVLYDPDCEYADEIDGTPTEDWRAALDWADGELLRQRDAISANLSRSIFALQAALAELLADHSGRIAGMMKFDRQEKKSDG
jgi:hypothetical protein